MNPFSSGSVRWLKTGRHEEPQGRPRGDHCPRTSGIPASFPFHLHALASDGVCAATGLFYGLPGLDLQLVGRLFSHRALTEAGDVTCVPTRHSPQANSALAPIQYPRLL